MLFPNYIPTVEFGEGKDLYSVEKELNINMVKTYYRNLIKLVFQLKPTLVTFSTEIPLVL
jgi:hypothetical protein